MADYETTRKDFEVFKAECQKWIDYWGLSSYNFYFFHEVPDGLPRCRAACRSDYCARHVSLFLNTVWDEPPVKNEIQLVAFHEVDEALLSRYHFLAQERFVSEDELEAARHEIIAIHSNTVFKGKKP